MNIDNDETIATIACYFLGLLPSEYWKKVVLSQNPRAVKKARKLLAAQRQALRDEVMGARTMVRCKDCKGAHFYKAVPTEVISTIFEGKEQPNE